MWNCETVEASEGAIGVGLDLETVVRVNGFVGHGEGAVGVGADLEAGVNGFVRHGGGNGETFVVLFAITVFFNGKRSFMYELRT